MPQVSHVPLITVMLVDMSIPTEFFHYEENARDDMGNVSVKCKSGVVADPSFRYLYNEWGPIEKKDLASTS